jgi:hypothetical protein
MNVVETYNRWRLIMGFNDRIEDDNGFRDFLQQVIRHLEGTALGITRQVISSGQESLSDKQAFVFKKYVLDEFTVSECLRCGDEIPWSEMYYAATEHSMCSWCSHMSDKNGSWDV